jgi:multisubunit Na+/H+ antiporter MnhB subunit
MRERREMARRLFWGGTVQGPSWPAPTRLERTARWIFTIIGLVAAAILLFGGCDSPGMDWLAIVTIVVSTLSYLVVCGYFFELLHEANEPSWIGWVWPLTVLVWLTIGMGASLREAQRNRRKGGGDDAA